LHGGTYSSILLTAFSKLFTAFLQRHGFSLGVEDILVVKDAEERRAHFITRARKVSKTNYAYYLVFLSYLRRLLWSLWRKQV
jgi:DNA-directed RNA polymerase I subunit RPA1